MKQVCHCGRIETDYKECGCKTRSPNCSKPYPQSKEKGFVMRPWNEQIESRTFWDPNANNGEGEEVQKAQSLKDALVSSNFMLKEDFVRTIAAGLVMVMNAIEEMDKTK